MSKKKSLKKCWDQKVFLNKMMILWNWKLKFNLSSHLNFLLEDWNKSFCNFTWKLEYIVSEVCRYQYNFKGTVNGISSDPPFKWRANLNSIFWNLRPNRTDILVFYLINGYFPVVVYLQRDGLSWRRLKLKGAMLLGH